MDRMMNQPLSRRGNAGILLLVVLIGLAIGLWVMFGPTGSDGSSYADKVVETKNKGEETAKMIELDQITKLVTMYKLEHNRMPESLDDIPEAKVFKDAYGDPYRYRVIDDSTYELQSAGFDGTFDTDDDEFAQGRVQI